MREFFEDNDGALSSFRLAFNIMTLLFVPAFIIVWTYVSFSAKALAAIPAEVVGLLGTLLVGKALNKGVEVYGEVKKKSLDNSPTIS